MFQAITLASLLLAAVNLQGLEQVPDTTPAISRAEATMSLVLLRTPDIPIVKNNGQAADVPKGSWYEPYMLYAQQEGIISADPTTHTLRPHAPITRAEFLKMLTTAFSLPTGYSSIYTDIPTNAWFTPYVGLARYYQLFELDDARKLEPQRLVSKQEALHAFSVMNDVLEQREKGPTLEQNLAADQAREKLTLYTVISTRRQNVVLVDVPPPPVRTPFVRRIIIPPSIAQQRLQILALVNEARAAQKLAPLTTHAALEDSAQIFSQRLYTEGFFSHTAPDGETLKDRIARTSFYDRSFSADCLCVKGYALGENLARGQTTAKEAFDAWMKSPSHREAILHKDYTYIGIGVTGTIWVQHFAGILLPGS